MAKKNKITDLKFDDKNFNKHSEVGTGLLEKSLRKFGAGRSILLDRNNNIIAGNGVVETAAQIGIEDVQIVESDGTKIIAVKRTDIDLNTPQGREMALADNQVAVKNIVLDAEVIEAELGEAICEEWLIDTENEISEAVDDDFNGVAPKIPITVLGDLYEINEHRLLCGDSTDSDQVAKLMNGKKADMVFTDPPYGINIVDNKGKIGQENLAKQSIYKQIIGDDTTETAKEFYQTCQSLGFENYIIWGGNYFTDFLPPKSCWIIWDKKGKMESNNFADGEMAWTSFDSPVRLKKHIWRGMIKQGENSKRVHPTQKPIQLCSDLINDYTKGNNIYDGFGGSGSTMIACHQIKKKCFMVEMSPDYCDVIVARMVKHLKEMGSSLTIKRNGQQLNDKEKWAAA